MPGGSVGLTSYPYVAIQAGGVLVSGGDTHGSVSVNSTSVVVWAKNGDTTQPYCSASSAGLTIKAGSYETLVSSSGILLSDGTNGMVLNSTGLTIIKGNNAVVLTASDFYLYSVNGNTAYPHVHITSGGVTIVGGVLTSPTITGGALTITTSTSSVVSVGPSTNGIEVSVGTSLARVMPSAFFISLGSVSSALSTASLVIGTGGSATAALAPTGLKIDTLPSSSPGTKQFWYDPADGNRVKYTP